MEYPNIVLDLMNRVMGLEERVLRLEQMNSELESKSKAIKSATRKEIRKRILNKLQEENRPEIFNFNVATREEGSGIKFEYKLKNRPNESYPTAFKFYSSNVTSNPYNKDGGINVVWFTVKKEDIDQIIRVKENCEANKKAKAYIDGLIFAAIDEQNNEELVLILPGINVSKLIEEKGYDTYDKNENYHFYFEKKSDGRILETRDCKVGGIDLTKYANDYSILKKFYIERNEDLV